jgi:solute carrier family 25 folate transporter 32
MVKTGSLSALATDKSNDKLVERSRFAPLYAGLSAGCTSTFLLYPLELIKVRMQVNETYKAGSRSSQFFTELRTLVNNFEASSGRKQGIWGLSKYRALYNGLTPSLVGNGVSWGGYFFVYEGVKERLLEYKRKNAALHSSSTDVHLESLDFMASACVSGTIMVLMTNPIWLVKTRIQLQLPTTSLSSGSGPTSSASAGSVAAGSAPVGCSNRNYSGILDGVQQIVKEEGLLALYKGVGPALMLVSHGVVQFAVYENLKKAFPSYSKRKEGASVSVAEKLIDSSGYLAMGAASKMIASTLTYPIQVIKSRLQQRNVTFEIIQTDQSSLKTHNNANPPTGKVVEVSRNYTSVLSTVKRIYANEGFPGFFKGCIANGARVAPNAAITFVVYETIVDTWGR